MIRRMAFQAVHPERDRLEGRSPCVAEYVRILAIVPWHGPTSHAAGYSLVRNAA